jgi:hypothetical protein
MKRLQSLIDIVYPYAGYQVEWGDNFCQMVCWNFFSWLIDAEGCTMRA